MGKKEAAGRHCQRRKNPIIDLNLFQVYKKFGKETLKEANINSPKKLYKEFFMLHTLIIIHIIV